VAGGRSGCTRMSLKSSNRDLADALKSPQTSHGVLSCMVSRRSWRAAALRLDWWLAGKCVLPTHRPVPDSRARMTDRVSEGSLPS